MRTSALALQSQDSTAILNAPKQAAKGESIDDCPTVELFMLYTEGYYSKTLLCREQAEELAVFVRDATGKQVAIKQVEIGFCIYHAVDVAEGWIDDSQAMDDVDR